MSKQPKKQGFSIQGFDAQAYKQTEAYVQAIDALYNQAIMEFAQLATQAKVNQDKPFAFKDYPATQAKVQQIVNALAAKMQAVITKGSREQWLYACKKNDDFIASILNTSKINPKKLQKMQDRNLEALKTFQGRKVNGMDLSQRVWKYTGQLKTTMELGIDVALGKGTSAAQLSRELRKYLQEPDNLFRKVKDKHGNLVLSKAAKALHPGQGVYRSSYKNAMRLTRSEINLAYKEADQLRWQQLDFVVGYEIKLSNNHTLNGEPFVDICDKLAGKYPKSFKFKGWHPQCRCLVVPILQDREEFNDDELADLKSALNGKEYQKYASKNTVTDVPDSFKEWIHENAERSRNWASQPYFIKDNFKGGTIDGGLAFDTITIQRPTIKQPVSFKTPEDVINRTNEVGKDWFHRGFKRLEIERRTGINGATDRYGTIWLKRERLDYTKSGLSKLANGQSVTFEESDALATYWHEITHCRNKAPVTNLTALQRSNMELANEYVARNTLPDFYKAMGAKEVPHSQLMQSRESTGYNQMVVNYDRLLGVLGVDKQRALSIVKDYLFNKPYSQQIDGLVEAIYSQKARNSQGQLLGKTEIKRLIKHCSWYKTDMFEDIMTRELGKK